MGREMKTCTKCGVEKPIIDFHTRFDRGVSRYRAQCKLCHNATSKRFYEAEGQAARRLRQYGITSEQYVQMLTEQGGVCAICMRTEAPRPLVIDHCHETKKVCGLLCSSCNLGLGKFNDNPAFLLQAADYLRSV